jgi:hypothetical protein
MKTVTVPSSPKEVANNPLVRGIKGAPNRWSIPEDLHKAIHGAGKYNAFWKNSLRQLQRSPTVQDVLKIKAEAIRVFKLAPYAPK